MGIPEKLATHRIHKTTTTEKHNTICVGHRYAQKTSQIT